MIQVDILLRQLPEEYDIVVCNKHTYDIILNDRYQSHDVYIYNLTDRQGIYGDELDPLIFRLTENTIDCLLDVSLLETALLHGYDNRLINNLDNYPLYVLEHGGGYNYFALKTNNVSVRNTACVGLQEHIARLTSNVDMALVEVMGAEQNNMSLSTSGEITNIASIKTPELSTRLTNQITDDISTVCELLLNASGVHWFDGYLYNYDGMLLSDMDLTYPKMSLVSMCGKVYMKFSFGLEKDTMSLGSSIPDFITTINLKDTIRNNLHLNANAALSYQVICSCNPISSHLNSTEVSVKITAILSPTEINYTPTDWIRQDIRTQVAIDATSQSKLITSVTEDIEAYYGLGRYDNRYLYYWDDYTISNMSAEIVNQAGGSVDM